MHLSTRRQFLQTSAVLSAAALLGSSFSTKKYNPLLSFSTLGCPDWTFDQITDFAVRYGFKGLEIRGILRQIDLTKAEPFATPEKISATLEMMKAKGLVFVNLGSSATLHFAKDAERKKQLDDGRRFIDLAQQINCPFVRVYPNNFPKDQEKQQTMELIANGLRELGDYAKDRNVKVLMETHGEVVKIADLAAIMKAASHSHVGLVWDPCNMWAVTKESPIEMYKQLKKYIHHTHIKDANLVNGKPQYVLLGQGEVPIFEAIDVLAKDNYKGYFSFEWEKLWHPELLEPEIAFADYPLAMKKHFNK